MHKIGEKESKVFFFGGVNLGHILVVVVVVPLVK